MLNPRRVLPLGFALLLGACGGGGDRAGGRGGDAGPPAPGGTAIMGISADFSGLNPVTNSAVATGDVLNYMLFTPLIQYDEKLQPAPALAERWELTDTSVTFFLRNDVTWHDGRPVTAEDVKFTFDIAKQPETASLLASAFLNQVRSATVRDPRTIHFTFEAPHAQALDGFFWAPIPKHLLGNVAPGELAQAPYNQQPVGNGPFRFGSWEKGQRLTLVANPNFPQALGGRPNLDQMVFRVIPEATTMTTELVTGTVDALGFTIQPDQAKQIENQSNVVLNHYPSREFYYLGWNNTKEMFSDARVRRALAMATNRGQMIEALLQGYGQPAHGMIPPWSPMYTATEGVPYNQAAARQLLAEAGWRDTNGDGIVDRNGRPMRFNLLINTGSTLKADLATVIQRQLREIGVDAQINQVEFQTMLKQHKSREYDAIIANWSLDNFKVDPTPLFSCAEARKQGSANRAGYCNPQADQLLQQGLRTTDTNQAKQLWAQYNQILQQDQPVTFLFWSEDLGAVGPRLQNVEMDVRSKLVNVEDWYIPENRRRS